MTKFANTSSAAMCGLACVLLAQQPGPTGAEPSQHSSASEKAPNNGSLYANEIAEAWRLLKAGKVDSAVERFQTIVTNAQTRKDSATEAEGHLGLSAADGPKANFRGMQQQAEQALAIFTALHDAVNIARAQQRLGLAFYESGDNKSAKGLYNEALKVYELRGMQREKAGVLRELALATDGYAERIKLDNQALEIAKQIGDRPLQGQTLHDIGQWQFIQGDSETAEKTFKAAESLLDAPEDEALRERVLVSEARVHRAHGEWERAIEVDRAALKSAQRMGDVPGQVKILNDLAVSFGDQNKNREALEMFQAALELAKDTNSARLTDVIRQNIAEAYIKLGEYQRGADLIEEMNRRTPDPFPYGAQYRYATLGLAYQNLKDYDHALAAATRSVEEARAHKNGQFVSEPLIEKAQAEEMLGRSQEALNDVREALNAIEELRQHLVPKDFMKRGFAEKTQQAFAYAIELQEAMNQTAQAAATAEEARSRAFLDLLASHQIALRSSREKDFTTDKTLVVASAHPDDRPAPVGPKSKPSDSDAIPGVITRGGKLAAGSGAAVNAEPELASAAFSESASLDEMRAQARRLHSTILNYWIGENEAFVWVMSTDGSLHSARISSTRQHLADLVRGVWPSATQVAPAPGPDSAERKSTAAPPHGRTEFHFQGRGDGNLAVKREQRDGWRQLYRMLVEPVEPYLPSQEGSRITIIPHGPLFGLPFAGLRDAKGRYFLERYTLEYAPAISILRFTSAREPQGKKQHFLLLADPSDMEKFGLPQLPASRQEVAEVARAMPASEATVLTGAEARSETLRSEAAKSTVIHLATHGIIDDTKPFDSFLALADRKLTVRDIYGWNLDADLVFLSSCRSGMGKVTGDGVLGLTRAFFYAGTRSVIATLWDVADEPTSRLVANFYDDMSRGVDRAQALRAAQLSILKRLREGKMQVNTTAGKLTLPENPVFWASFVLIGEP